MCSGPPHYRSLPHWQQCLHFSTCNLKNVLCLPRWTPFTQNSIQRLREGLLCSVHPGPGRCSIIAHRLHCLETIPHSRPASRGRGTSDAYAPKGQSITETYQCSYRRKASNGQRCERILPSADTDGRDEECTHSAADHIIALQALNVSDSRLPTLAGASETHPDELVHMLCHQLRWALAALRWTLLEPRDTPKLATALPVVWDALYPCLSGTG
jgi:hypothetical protein